MTREQAIAVHALEKPPYDQGRELAKREVVHGKEHMKKWIGYDFSIFRDNLGDRWPEYARGFWEYVNAWQVVNQ